MTPLPALAARSAWNRRGTLALVVLAIALATLLLLTTERLRQDLRASFTNAVSGTDLVVGARGSAVQLLLHAVFHLGAAANDIRMDSVEAIRAHRAVAWVVPIELGDTHRGMPVLDTTPAYFERFRFGDREPLVFAAGRPFAGTLDGLYEAVIGAEVARRLGTGLGERLVIAHGGGEIGHAHEDKPFAVVGVLAPTGTPVDRTIHVDLKGLAAVHLEWAGGAPLPGVSIPPDQARKFDLEPKTVGAALVGLKGRAAVFNVQRFVDDYPGEPLSAVLPGVALDELWQIVGLGERALLAMSALVAAVSLAGLVATILAGLGERRRELAVLRAVGAGPRQLLALLAIEALFVTGVGALLGLLGALAAVAAAAPWLREHAGLVLQLAAPGWREAGLLAAVVAAGLLAGLVPGWRAYRLSLADGLSPRS